MSRAVTATLLLLVFLLAGCAAQAPRADADGDRLLVTIPYEKADALRGDPGDRYRRPGGYGAGASADPLLDAIAAEYALTRVGGWPMRALGVHCEVYAVARGADAAALAARMAHDPRIDSVEPMRRFHTLTGTADRSYRALQHSLDALQIDAAHALSRGAGVRIAVVDSGIDDRHPDLAGAVELKRDYAGGPLAAHGTEVAGVIAARDANGAGIVGVAPAAELVDLRACRAQADPNAPADCDSYTLAQAVDFAISRRVDVINLSLSGPYDPLLARLLAAAEANGITVVAAAAANKPGFPASLPSVIGVASSEDAGASPPGVVHAPGVDVLTTFPHDRYDYGSGSSLASAHVSGVVALMRGLDRQLAPADIRALLAAQQPLSAAAVLTEEAARLARR